MLFCLWKFKIKSKDEPNEPTRQTDRHTFVYKNKPKKEKKEKENTCLQVTKRKKTQWLCDQQVIQTLSWPSIFALQLTSISMMDILFRSAAMWIGRFPGRMIKRYQSFVVSLLAAGYKSFDQGNNGLREEKKMRKIERKEGYTGREGR